MNPKYDRIVVLDLDGTVLDSKGDWGIKYLKAKNLCNLDLIQETDSIIIITGRYQDQESQIRELFSKYSIKDVHCRDWEKTDEMTEIDFMLKYWNWKMKLILAENRWAGKEFIVFDDDIVLCKMCERFEIKYKHISIDNFSK